MAKSKKEEAPKISLVPITMISAQELFEHPKNRNRQNRHTFKELKESMQENGFDESLVVVPRENNEPGYWIVAGNHRFRAGKELGMQEFPCTLHTDWDSVKQQVELIRRNWVKGKISKEDFTLAVNQMKQEDKDMDNLILAERLGFENPDKFAEMYQQQVEQEERIVHDQIGDIAQKAKIVEDLGLVISSLLEKYGDTVPNSFVVFPVGGKNHVFVQSTPTLKRTLEAVFTRCIGTGMDINVALGGLLSIGMHHSNFKDSEDKFKDVKDAGTEDGDSEFDSLSDDAEEDV